ncbi:hypothetical protein [Microlunatus sp. GCM10028923]|uniref:hypothetical protein n=1 Tax=Microlunatus sp. GCM10028923 TaxID=3273400 RepID=UPI003610DA40
MSDDDPNDRHLLVRAVAAVLVLLALTVGLLVWGQFGATLAGVAGWMITGGLVIVVAVFVAIYGRTRPVVAGMITLGTAVAVATSVAVPLLSWRAEYHGTGVIWMSDLPATDERLEPYAVIGDAAVLKGDDRLVFLDLSTGHHRGTLPYQIGDRLAVAGERLLIGSNDRFQLYDAAARPLWPEPIAADYPVAATPDVVVLGSPCSLGDICAFGLDPGGRKVWQRRISTTISTGMARLPALIASKTGPDDWTVLDAADGSARGTVEADVALASGSTVTAVRVDQGSCEVTGENQPTGETFDCSDPPWFRWVADQLAYVEDSDGRGTLVRLDAAGGQLEEVDEDTALGLEPEIGLSRLGWARLSNQTLEFGDWPSGLGRASRSTGPLPIEPDTIRGLARVLVKDGTAVVDGPAEPRPGQHNTDRQLIIFDLPGGTETARLRLPENLSGSVTRDNTLSTGPGQALICLPDRPPMLIGRPA